ncbi:MAG: hypothetical protein RR058_03155 [Oscillospiraceae bacterium]
MVSVIFCIVVFFFTVSRWYKIASALLIGRRMIRTLETNGAVLNDGVRFKLTTGCIIVNALFLGVYLAIYLIWFRPYMTAFYIANAISVLLSLILVLGAIEENVYDFCCKYCIDDYLITDDGRSFEEVSEALNEKQAQAFYKH